MTKDGDGKVGSWPVPGYAYYQSDPAADIELWRCVLPQYAPPLVSLAIYLQSARGSGEGGAADPNPYQFNLARRTLTMAGESAPANATVDRLARELVQFLVKALDGLGLSGDAGGWEAAWQRVMTEQRAELRKEILAELESQGRGAAAVESKAVARGVRIDYQRVEARLCVAAGTEASDGEMLALSVKAADFLAGIGRDGAKQAEEMRTAARKQWAAWGEYRRTHNPASWFDAWQSEPAVCPDLLRPYRLKEQAELVAYIEGRSPWFPECKYLLALARAVWLDVVKPRIERERRRVPALATPVLTSLVTVATPGAVRAEGLRLVTRRGAAVAAADRGQVEAVAKRLRPKAPALVDAVLAEVLTDCVRAVQTLHGQRLLRYLVRAGAYALVSGELAGQVGVEAVDLVIVGGFDKLRSDVGVTTRKAIPKLREALAALEVLRVASDNHGLSAAALLQLVEEWKAVRGRPAQMTIRLNWPLLPIGGAKLQGHGRLLVPMPETVPALVGRQNEHGAQATMHLRMMMLFSERSPELAERGGLVLTARDWHKAADESGVHSELIADVQAAWYKGGGLLIPPVLRAVDDKRTTLHDDKARELLMEQGKIRTANSKRTRRRRKPRPE